MTEPNYKELSKELYEILKELLDVIKLFQITPVLGSKIDRIDNFLHKYEEATNRGTGRTTILYHKAITEALENPGKSVEFVDHYPYTWEIAILHREKLQRIINKLDYDIEVGITKNKVYLYNKFGQ